MFNSKLISYTVLFITFGINFSTCILYPTNSLTIVEFEGALAYFAENSTYGSVTACEAIIKNESYKLDLKIQPAQQHVIEDVGTVERFSTTECGVRITNISKKIPDIKIIGYYQNIDNLTDVLKISVSSPLSGPRVINKTVDNTVGVQTVTCPGEGESETRYCRLFDNNGKVYEKCSHTFTYSSAFNSWRCRVLRWGDMQETESVINFIEEDARKTFVKNITETDSHVILSCKYYKAISFCRAETPKKFQLNIGNGLVSDRYSSYKTFVSSGLCSLELKKPLDADDIGIWRFYFDTTADRGCVFDISDLGTQSRGDKNLTEIAPIENQIKTIEVTQGTSVTLKCQVTYEISYCYLQPPKNYEKHIDPTNFDNFKYLGICSFLVTNVASGIWTCGINSNTGATDVLTEFDIKVYKEPVALLVQTTRASKGDTAKFLCKTLESAPITYCRFVTPNGEIHSVSDNMILTTRFKYYGAGFLHGDCGIEIDKLEESDFGGWSCTVKVSNKEYTVDMNLEKNTVSSAWAIGLGVGTAVVVLIASAYFGYRYRNRNQYSSGNIALSDTNTSSRDSFQS